MKNNKKHIKKRLKKNSNQNYFQVANKKVDATLERKKYYLPVYSHMYISSENYIKLNISLSIRNTDLSEDLYIERIDYYNTEGKLVKNYIPQPHILKPMGTVDFSVELNDMSGGNGAKFLVTFATKSTMSKPIIQGIMSNIIGNNQVVFTTDGQLL